MQQRSRIFLCRTSRAVNSDAFYFLFLFNLYSSKKKGAIESKISFARVTRPRGVFLPMSAFPPIFQRFKYRSAVEQTSSAQYRLSVRSQTAGQLDAHQPARLTRERKAASQVNFTYYSLRRKKSLFATESTADHLFK